MTIATIHAVAERETPSITIRKYRAISRRRHFARLHRLERMMRGVSNRQLERFCRIIIRFQRTRSWLSAPFKRVEALENLAMILENDSVMWAMLKRQQKRESAAFLRGLRRYCEHKGITISEWNKGVSSSRSR